jgi:signal transduction histidine kinase/ligand-binding sensor domain-containing protein
VFKRSLTSFITLLTVVLSLPLQAQQFIVSEFRTEDGLQTDLIKCVAQDPLGFIWIGSDDGLIMYDGVNFKRYPYAGSSQYFKDFLTRQDGRLWAVHDLGVLEIKNLGDTVVFENVLEGSITKNDSMVWRPKKAFQDAHGSIWISEPQSVVKMNDGKWERFDFPPEDNSTSFVRSFDFLEISKDSILISSYHGNFYIYSYLTGSLSKLSSNKKIVVNRMKEVADHFYAGSSTDLYELTLRNGVVELTSLGLSLKLTDLVEVDDESFIACAENTASFLIRRKGANIEVSRVGELNVPINQAFVDDEGVIWLSTLRGLLILQKSQFRTVKLTVPRVFIESIVEDTSTNTLYAFSKENIWEIDMEREQVRYAKEYPGGYFLSGKVARGGLWISNEFSLWNLKNGEVVHQLDFRDEGRYLFDVQSTKSGNLWMSQEANVGVHEIDMETFRLNHYGEEKGLNQMITAIREHRDGVYVAANNANSYLHFKQNDTDGFVNVSHTMRVDPGPGFMVEGLNFLGSNIWIATNRGLFCHTPDSVYKVDFNGELNTAAIRSLEEDDPFLWMGTSLGLIRYNTTTNEYSTFNEQVGLLTNSITEEGLLISNKKIWVGTSFGLAVMDYSDGRDQKTKSPVFLEVLENGANVDFWDSRPEIANSSFLEIRYASLSFPSDQVEYSYRISELTREWSDPSLDHMIQISDLEQGEYNLEVRAKKIGDYSWSEPADLAFIIHPSFYDTPTFYGLVLSLIMMFSLGTRYVTRRLAKQREETLKKVVSERTKELKEYKDNLEKLVSERTRELEEAQKQLVQSEKMASLGTLTAGVAHEINNPINYIQAGLYSLKSLLGNPKESKLDPELNTTIEKVTSNMQFGVDRVTKIVRGLGVFSRQSDSQKTNCDLVAIIDNCLLILTHEIKHKCEIKKDYTETPLFVLGDESKLHQLFTNILSNSIQAIEGTGTVQIITKRSAGKIMVEIHDDGSGIDKADTDKLFDPFFTTKPPGKGTGLGLYISLMIAEDHNAQIKFEPRAKKGTKTIIIFG